MKTTFVTLIVLFLGLVVASPTFKTDGDTDVEDKSIGFDQQMVL
jgi:hypothetical protein